MNAPSRSTFSRDFDVSWWVNADAMLAIALALGVERLFCGVNDDAGLRAANVLAGTRNISSRIAAGSEASVTHATLASSSVRASRASRSSCPTARWNLALSLAMSLPSSDTRSRSRASNPTSSSRSASSTSKHTRITELTHAANVHAASIPAGHLFCRSYRAMTARWLEMNVRQTLNASIFFPESFISSRTMLQTIEGISTKSGDGTWTSGRGWWWGG